MTCFISGRILSEISQEDRGHSWNRGKAEIQLYCKNNWTHSVWTNIREAWDTDGRPLHGVLADIAEIPKYWAHVIKPIGQLR